MKQSKIILTRKNEKYKTKFDILKTIKNLHHKIRKIWNKIFEFREKKESETKLDNFPKKKN